MGPQEDYLETVLTCEGDYYDPEFHRGLEYFSQKLESLINADNGKLILKKVEPWNSVRVTFNIPKEAAVRLKQLAEQGDHTLKDLGILAVQIEGDRSISLTIAGRNNETTELVFRTTNGASSANAAVYDSSAEDLLPGPSNLEATRANIAECLRAQSEAGTHLVNVFMRQQQPQAPPSVTIPTNQVNQPALYGSPSRSPSHSASSAGSQLPVPQGKSPPGFPSPSQSVSQQSFPSPGSSRSQPSPVSPQYPTPPPSQPSHPSSPGIRSNSLAYTHHNPTVNNVQGLRMNKDITSASPLLVNLLQTEVSQQQQQHFNSISQLPMPPPFDGGPAVKKRKRTRRKDRIKVGPVEGEISVPGLPLPTGSETRVPPIAGSDNFMQQSPSPHGDGNLQGLASSLSASLSQPSTPSSQQAHSWVRHASSPSQVSGNVTPPVVLPHNNKNVRCSPDKPTNPQHIINPYTGQLEPVDCGGVSADSKDMVIKTEASDTYGDVSSQLKPPPNPLVAIQQHMAASENSGQQHRVSSPSCNTSSSAGNSGSFFSGLTMSQMPRLPPYPSSTKPKPLHRSGSPANAGNVSAAVGSMTLPGSTNTGSMGYSSVLSGLKRSSSGLFAGSHGSSPSSSQVPTSASNPRHRFSPVTSLTSPVSGSSSLVSTVSSVLSGEKNHLPDSRAIPNSPSDSQGRVRSNCGLPQAQNSSVTQGISIPSDRLLTVTSVASQVANVMSYAANSDNLSRSAACSPVQSLQKSRNIHSQSPTASLSLSVSQTLSAYPDRTLPASLLPGLDTSGSSDLRPSSTPLSSRSSTPKIKSEHESVTAILKEAASHFIPIPKDNPENFIPNPVKVKEEPISKECTVKESQKTVTSSGELTSNTTASQVAHSGVQKNAGGSLWTDQHHLKRMETKSLSGAPSDFGSSNNNPSIVKSGTSEVSVPNLPIRTATSLSGVVSSVSVASSRSEQPVARPNITLENQEPGSLKESQTSAGKSHYENAVKQESAPAKVSEQTKNLSDSNIPQNDGGLKHQSNHHGDVAAKTPPSPHENKGTTEDSHGMNNIDMQPHTKDANNCHDTVSDRLFDGKLLDVPPLLNADQGVDISSVTQSDLHTISRGSNGASLGEASPLSSDNASSTGQPNAGQSPITNMIGHLNNDSELSSHSFDDHVAVNSEESNNVPTKHNGGTNNKDRDNVPPQHPSQADHKNIITVGYASFSKDNPVVLNNGFTNDKLFKNLNSMSYLTKSFLDLENNDVKGVRISTDFLQKERINPGLVRRASQESDGERYRVKPSLMTENHLNLTSCLSLPAKLLGKSDLNPGGLPLDKSAADAKINGSSPSESAKSVSSVVTNPSECSVNGSLSGESHDNGLPSRKSPLSKDAECQNGNEETGRKEKEEEKDQKSRSLAQTVMIISPPSLRTSDKLLPNLHIVSKNESSLPSSRATAWAGSNVALLPASDGDPVSRAEQTDDLTPNTGSSTENLASSRTVITAASSSSLFPSEMTQGKEGICQGPTENCPTSAHQMVPSSLPSLIPADKTTGSGLLSTVQTQSQVTSGKTNGLGCNVPDKSQEVTLHMKNQDVTEKSESKKNVDGILKTTPNGDHPGITGLLAHHSKVVQSKGISILKPLLDRDEERDEDLIYSPSTDKMRSLSESLIAGHATQDSPHKVSHSNLVISTMLGEEDKTSKDVIRVSLPLVCSPHSKAARSNSYSKTNPKSSFSDFPNNASRLSSFVSKSIHTPVHNSASHTITAPGFHLNLTESVQRVIPSMDTLSPPHDKATFTLPRVNQSPPINLSPPAVEKKSPTQKVHSGNTTLESGKSHSGKVTPELPTSEDVRNDHYLAMAQRFFARTTVSVVSTQGSKTVTTVSSSVSGQACSSGVATVTSRTVVTAPVQDQLTTVKSEPLVAASVSPVSSASGTTALPTITDSSISPVETNSASSASVVTKNEMTDSGTAPVTTSPTLECNNTTDSVTVTFNAPESVKLETEESYKETLETQTVSVAAKTEIVPLQSESVKTVESITTADGSENKSPSESKVEGSSAKIEVAARQSRRLQAKMEQIALEHEETGPGRPARIRKYSTESIKSESSEVHAEGMHTRSGRARRASTESIKSVEEQGRASRMTRCGSRESAESRSGSRESGHGKEESPKGTSTRNRLTSGSSEDLIEERKARLGELRTGTPSPTPRATRTSTRSVRKKVPEGFVDTSASKTTCDAETGSKTRGSKRRLALDEHGLETLPDKKARNDDSACGSSSEEAGKCKANLKTDKGAVGLDSVASSVANRVRGKQDALRTPVKDPVTPQKVSPSKENVADEHSYSNKKPGKVKPAPVIKKPAVVEQKNVIAKTRQTGRSKSPIPELSGRNRSSKQPAVEEKVTSSATTSASSAPGPTPVKRSTRSTRTKEVADSANTPSAAGKRRRVSRDQR